MCLEEKWFRDSAKRKKWRDEFGLSVKDAEEDLELYNSTLYPVAVEVAKYILANWNEKQIALLSKKGKEVLEKVKVNKSGWGEL